MMIHIFFSYFLIINHQEKGKIPRCDLQPFFKEEPIIHCAKEKEHTVRQYVDKTLHTNQKCEQYEPYNIQG